MPLDIAPDSIAAGEAYIVAVDHGSESALVAVAELRKRMPDTPQTVSLLDLVRNIDVRRAVESFAFQRHLESSCGRSTLIDDQVSRNALTPAEQILGVDELDRRTAE